MKLDDLRKVIREEVTKVVRKELVGFVHLLGESNTPKPKKTKVVKKVVKKKKPVVSEQSLKDMLGEFRTENSEVEKEQPPQNFTRNPVLNNILNETANEVGTKPGHEEYPTMGGGTMDKSKMAEMMGYGSGPGQQATMTTPDGRPVSEIPVDVANAMTRDYGDLMKAIDKKKGGSPLKP
jgi:hypothetical protein